jgi:predicted deacylase
MIESRLLQVPAAADPGTQIPITTVRGAKPGPVLALIAGNHGYEYPPILALQQFRAEIAPEQLQSSAARSTSVRWTERT